MCLWCPFPRALRAEGERCTGQKVSLCSLPCLEGSHIRSQAIPAHRNAGAGSCLHPCGTGSSVGLCSCAVTTTSWLLLTCIFTTVQTIYPIPWAMCSAVAKLLPVQFGSAHQNAFCWGPQLPARTLKMSPSVFYKSCGHLSSSLNVLTHDPCGLSIISVIVFMTECTTNNVSASVGPFWACWLW